LRVAKVGFFDERFSLQATAGAALERPIELKPGRGGVSVESHPDGADGVIDGAKQGQTPLVVEGVELGQGFPVGVRHAGCEATTRAVALTERSPRGTVEVELERASTLGESSKPQDAARAEPVAPEPPSPPPTAATGAPSGYLIVTTQ